MTAHNINTHTVTLIDFPLVRRLTGRGIVLDNEIGFTRDPVGAETAVISNLLPWQRSLHTLVARSDKQSVVGQFRLKAEKQHAQVVYIAPHLSEKAEDRVWLHVLDAMARQAGKSGAHLLTAEVDEDSPLFEIMRQAGYAVYARQSIWQRKPGDETLDRRIDPTAIALDIKSNDDLYEIAQHYCNLVPRLIQEIVIPGEENEGYIFRREGRIEGYVGKAEGKQGVYLTPCLHPDMYADSGAVIEAVIRQVDRARKQPVYVCVRRYQDWLDEALLALGFELNVAQAVMVKRITAGVRQASFVPLHEKLEAMPHTARPPTQGASERALDINNRSHDLFDGIPDH